MTVFDSGEVWAKFFDNYIGSSTYRSCLKLFNFLRDNNVAVTTTGCIIAYKEVTKDYMDVETMLIDHSIGRSPKVFSTVSMKPTRSKCVVVKVDPRCLLGHQDYGEVHNHMLWVFEYEVVADYDEDYVATGLVDVWDHVDDDYFICDADDVEGYDTWRRDEDFDDYVKRNEQSME